MLRLMMFVASGAFITTQAIASNVDPAQDPNQKIICKGKREKVFGTNFTGKPVCKTAAEWKEIEAESRREVQQLRDRYTDLGRAEGR